MLGATIKCGYSGPRWPKIWWSSDSVPSGRANGASLPIHLARRTRPMRLKAEIDRRADTDRSGRKLRTRKIDPERSLLAVQKSNRPCENYFGLTPSCRSLNPVPLACQRSDWASVRVSCVLRRKPCRLRATRRSGGRAFRRHNPLKFRPEAADAAVMQTVRTLGLKVANQVVDMGLLQATAEPAREILEVEKIDVVADKGFQDGRHRRLRKGGADASCAQTPTRLFGQQ